MPKSVSGPVVLLEFSMSPLNKGESVSKYVSRSLDIIDKSGLEYRINPKGTVIEGGWDDVFKVIKRCFDRMRRDCGRISTVIKIDYRKGRRGAMERKIKSVERRLKKTLKK